MHHVKSIALDANILIRAALGKRVSQLFEMYRPHVDFYTPDVCLIEAKKHVPAILAKHSHSKAEEALNTLDSLEREGIVQPMPFASYGILEYKAKQRIASRDPDDWSLVAVSLVLNCPIWTEDKDFFGTGVAVWNTANVEIYLKMQAEQ